MNPLPTVATQTEIRSANRLSTLAHKANRMNHSFHEKPAELTIDVEQWKRDIQTFAEATSKALNAIAAELSNTCSNGRTTTSQRDVTNPTNEIQPSQSSKFEASHSNSDGRLEKLKLQLASRISKTN